MPQYKRKHDSISASVSDASPSPPPAPRITRQSKKLLDAAAGAPSGTKGPGQRKGAVRQDCSAALGPSPAKALPQSRKSRRAIKSRPLVSAEDDNNAPEVHDPASSPPARDGRRLAVEVLLSPRQDSPARPVNSRLPKKGGFVPAPEEHYGNIAASVEHAPLSSPAAKSKL